MAFLVRFPLLLALACGAAACATTPAGPPVDLAPARAAVEEARNGGAPERAADVFARAESNLQRAESLAVSSEAAPRYEAARLAAVAEAEAHWALDLSRSTAASRHAAVTAAEADKLSARLRRAEEEQKRLEDRVALLQRDLEMTETELIRSKARLKGNETKAEASAAIAEARILMRRLSSDKSHASVLARCQESLAKAEEQLQGGNYGAAIFFAMKAQDTANRGAAPVTR